MDGTEDLPPPNPTEPEADPTEPIPNTQAAPAESPAASGESSKENSPPRPPTSSGVSPLLKYFYNSNPFYAISAAFVLLGLHYVFHDEAAVLATTAVDFNSWLLLGVIAGYCAILAATALVIVRLGKVWDDARTILCTLLLVLVALSVNFDKLALTNPVTFIKVLSLGLVFAVGLVEFMLKSLGIRMSLWFRVPLHLFLILFFLYPMTLSYFLDEIGGANNQKGYDATLWGILLFPFAAGLVTLSLLPASTLR